jgi:hypothetical protein
LYLLSGNQCAFPDCKHPIITTEGVYVGELCHICAAETGGERFDPTQNNEDRRKFENLMLMCHDHHVLTNDVAQFPVERMRQLKADHEARFERGLTTLMETASIQITNSTISLGGEGGKAPGAGGGGGGALGPNAQGGAGGSGGEMKAATFRISDDLVELRVHVGKAGGQGGADGKAGASGEDTYLEAVFRDGTVQEILRAKGGRGGDEDDGSIQISLALLANHAEVREGLLFAAGAGWEYYTVSSLPEQIAFAVAYLAESKSALQGTITTKILNPQNQEVASQSQRFVFSGRPIPFAVKAMTPVYEAGMWHVVLSCGERELRRLPFEVKLLVGDAS